jgi:hypothetical protein
MIYARIQGCVCMELSWLEGIPPRILNWFWHFHSTYSSNKEPNEAQVCNCDEIGFGQILGCHRSLNLSIKSLGDLKLSWYQKKGSCKFA